VFNGLTSFGRGGSPTLLVAEWSVKAVAAVERSASSLGPSTGLTCESAVSWLTAESRGPSALAQWTVTFATSAAQSSRASWAVVAVAAAAAAAGELGTPRAATVAQVSDEVSVVEVTRG